MYCISLNHKNAKAALREKFAFSENMRCRMIRQLKKDRLAEQCVLLCTCCRTELYFCADKTDVSKIINFMAECGNVTTEELVPYIKVYNDILAQKHLFRVACGITSMILGEDEILGQTKQAYYEAKKYGLVGFEMNKTFLAAITCAKRIKTETLLSKSAVSVATLSANEAVLSYGAKNILVIGASGKIGSTVVKNLMSHKNVSVFATIRDHGNEICFPKGVNTVNYKERYRHIATADCIISATSAPHYTVTLSEVRNNNIKGKKLFIDLAVPADIDENIESYSDFRRIGIDSFEKMAKDNNLAKIDSMHDAEKIIEEETDKLKKDIIFHNFIPFTEDFKKQILKSPEKVIYRLKSELNAEQFAAVTEVFLRKY